MKKKICIMLFTFISSFVFCLPNISIYSWYDYETEKTLAAKINDNIMYSSEDEPLFYIKDSGIYSIEDNSLSGTLEENDETFSLTIYDDSESNADGSSFIVNKKNGFILYEKEFLDNELNSEYFFDSDTGRLVRELYYVENNILFDETLYDKNNGYEIKYISYLEDSSIDFYTETSYLNNLVIEKEYDSTGKIICYTKQLIDSATGKMFRSTTYDSNNNVIEEFLFNGNSYIPYSIISFYSNGQLKDEVFGNPKNSKYMYRNTYSETGEKKEYIFIEFDSNKSFEIEKNIHLQSEIVNYSFLKDYAEKSKNSDIDWNEHYTAYVEMYDFTTENSFYKYINYLEDMNYLIDEKSIVLTDLLSNTLYCFAIKNFEIDISSCYKIELKDKTSSTNTRKPSYTYTAVDHYFCNINCKDKSGYTEINSDELEGIYYNASHLRANSKIYLKNISPSSFYSEYIYFDPGFIKVFNTDEELTRQLISNKTRKMDIYGHVFYSPSKGKEIMIDWLFMY